MAYLITHFYEDGNEAQHKAASADLRFPKVRQTRQTSCETKPEKW
jgi:hypothetical protein